MNIYGERYGEKCQVLDSISFLERNECGYIIKGTSYCYDYFNLTGRVEWIWYDLTSGSILSFEEVFESVSEGIRDNLIFYLDLFR
jgi:hypothetical protein